MKHDLRRGLTVGVIAAAASALVACSFLVTRGETQCSGPGDDGTCQASFGPTARCSNDGVCITKGGPCNTNAECLDREGAPAICRKDTKTCVRLTNADCPTVIGVSSGGQVVTDRRAVESDDTVILGSLASLYGSNQSKGEARVAAFQLALQEFAARPLPIAGKTRPLAFLSCTDTAEQGDAGGDPPVVRSARHLVEVGVPAIVGAGNSGTTTSALVETTAKGAVLIAPSATSPALTSNPNKMGLFFRTAPSDALQAIPLADAIGDVERLLTVPTKKLVFINKGDSYGQGLRDQLVNPSNLKLNNKPIGDAATYKGLEYGTEATFDFSSRIAETIAFEPNIIVIAGTSEAVEKLVKPLEAQWPSSKPRPYFIVSDGLKGASLLDLVKADDAAANPNPLRTRIRGTAPGRPTRITASFSLRFTSTFSDAKLANEVGSFGTAGAYDAAYLILYALGTVKTDINGQAIAAGVRRIAKKGATAVEVGPNGIDEARPFFTSGTDFDLNGASSPLDFNEAGESPADIEVWCVQKAVGNGTPAFFSTDKYFNSSTGGVVGTYNCPGTAPTGDAGADGG